MLVPRVHIRGLGDRGDKEEIRRHFEKFGPLTNVWIATKPPGFAYVFFKAFEDAEKAVDYLDGKEMCGVTVSVELSPVKDRNQRQDWDRSRPDHHHHHHSYEPRGEKRERRSRSSSYTDESGSEKDYDSDPDAKHDYERERYREGDRHHRSSRDGHYSRESSSYQGRGRPYYRGRGRGNYSNYQDRSDNRRQSYPGDRRGGYVSRGRGGWSDSRDKYNDGSGYRPRGRGGRSDYGDSNWSRNRGRGGSSDRYQSNYNPRGYDRGGYRPRGGRSYHGSDQYVSSRGRSSYKENPHHHRSRSDSGRYFSPPPSQSKHHHDHGSHRHKYDPPMDSEYVAKWYKVKNSGGGERSEGRRHGDMEHRQSRKHRKEEAYDGRSSKDYDADDGGYTHHSSRKEHYEEERRHHSGKKHGGEEVYYRKKERDPRGGHDRSPVSPSGDRYADQYQQAHRSRRKYSNPSPDDSRSRSRSMSSQSSDTSRGPSASPSPIPPRHKRIPSQYRTPSGSMSHSPSPGHYSHGYSPRRSSQHEHGTPPRSSVFPPAPAGEFFEENPSGFDPPLYPASYEAAAAAEYIIQEPKRGKYGDDDFVEEDKLVEFEPIKQASDFKSIKREVRSRDRQVVMGDKYSGKDRYVEVDSREIRHDVTRPLSESFDIVGSGHSSKHSSPQERRSHSDLKRRHSAHKEYGVSRRHVQKSSPMSERMMKGH